MFGNQLQLAQNKEYINVFEKVFSNNRELIKTLNEYYRNVGLGGPTSGGAKKKTTRAPKRKK
jgi:hypothetical protein